MSQYMIALHSQNGALYYNEDYNFFGEKNGTVYTNRQKAYEKMQYAMKYGTSLSGVFEVIPYRQTIKKFLKRIRNNYHIEITEDTNDNVIFSGTYAELKANRKDLLEKVVTSWDAVPMADDTTDIGIMI